MNTVIKISALAFTATTLLLAACVTPPKVRIDKDASINFASYKTFAWFAPQVEQPATQTKTEPPSTEATADAKQPVESLTESRIRAAVTVALQNKGYTPSESNAGFRVSYVLNVYERPKESGMRIGIGASGSSGNAGGNVGLSIPIGKRTETIAAMTIDIIDVARNTQVWTGSYESKVQTKDISDEETQRLANTILERFPVRTK